MELDLRSADRRDEESLQIGEGDLVTLHSETLDCELTVRVTHPESGNLGGNLAESPATPHLEAGDHLHFRPEHVLSLE